MCIDNGLRMQGHCQNVRWHWSECAGTLGQWVRSLLSFCPSTLPWIREKMALVCAHFYQYQWTFTFTQPKSLQCFGQTETTIFTLKGVRPIESTIYIAHWIQNRLIINLWQHCIEGDREFKTKGIIGGGRWGYQCYQNYHLVEGWTPSGMIVIQLSEMWVPYI